MVQLSLKPARLSRLFFLSVMLPLLSAVASAQTCTYNLGGIAPPGPIDLAAEGGAGTIPLSTQTGCVWTASSTAAWFTITSGTGTGSGGVGVSYTKNDTGATRTGALVVGGATFNLTQAAQVTSPSNCTYSFNFTPPGNIGLDAAGGATTVQLNTGTGCAWAAASAVSWITVTTATGTGTSLVGITFQANTTGATRVGSIIIQGTTISFSQAPTGGGGGSTGCTYSFTFTPPGPITLDAPGGVLTMLVGTQTGCTWTATTTTPWITITTASGTGTSNAVLAYSTNTTGATRTGSVIVAGATINLVQPATANSTPIVTPSLLSFSYQIGAAAPAAQVITIAGLGSGGQARTFTVDTPAVSWIAVTPISGTAPAGTATTLSVSPLPSGLVAGTYNTSLTIRLPSEGNALTVPVSLTVQAGGGGSSSNPAFSHIADSQGWQTTLLLLNLDTEPAPYTLQFYGSQTTGRSAFAPLELSFVGVAGRSSQLSGTIPVGGVRILRTAGTDAFLNMGWAHLTTTRRIGGSGIFRDTNGRQEAAVSLNAPVSAFRVPFDNTSGQVTSYALVNTNSTQQVIVNVTVRNEDGFTLATLPITLPSRGHVATETNTQFPASANQRGSIEFRTTSPDITGLGLSFSAVVPGTSRAFTSLPIQPLP